MHKRTIYHIDKSKTLAALSIVIRAFAGGHSRHYWNAEARKLVPGWSLLKCIQWLGGQKCRHTLARIKDNELAALNLNSDTAKTLLAVADQLDTFNRSGLPCKVVKTSMKSSKPLDQFQDEVRQNFEAFEEKVGRGEVDDPRKNPEFIANCEITAQALESLIKQLEAGEVSAFAMRLFGFDGKTYDISCGGSDEELAQILTQFHIFLAKHNSANVKPMPDNPAK